MTRKDYVLLADALNRAQNISTVGAKDSTSGVWIAVYQVADALSHDNPRFDKEQFFTACGF